MSAPGVWLGDAQVAETRGLLRAVHRELTCATEEDRAADSREHLSNPLVELNFGAVEVGAGDHVASAVSAVFVQDLT